MTEQAWFWFGFISIEYEVVILFLVLVITYYYLCEQKELTTRLCCANVQKGGGSFGAWLQLLTDRLILQHQDGTVIELHSLLVLSIGCFFGVNASENN